MKSILPFFLSGLLSIAVAGCATHDERDPDAVVIGETTGGPQGAPRDYDRRDDDIVDERGTAPRSFDSLADYDDVLTDQERSVLRQRALDNNDDRDDYLEYLTEREKANLRERSRNLIGG